MNEGESDRKSENGNDQLCGIEVDLECLEQVRRPGERY
jgi:hypothetical protein